MKLLGRIRAPLDELNEARRQVVGAIETTAERMRNLGLVRLDNPCERCGRAEAVHPCVCEPHYCETCYPIVLAEQEAS